jgi:hypothetical protein
MIIKLAQMHDIEDAMEVRRSIGDETLVAAINRCNDKLGWTKLREEAAPSDVITALRRLTEEAIRRTEALKKLAEE